MNPTKTTAECVRLFLSYLARNAPEFIILDAKEDFLKGYFAQMLNQATEKRYHPLRVRPITIAHEFARIALLHEIKENELEILMSVYYSACSIKDAKFYLRRLNDRDSSLLPRALSRM